MAHPLEICPMGRDCVTCPHPGAFWAPVRLWTGVLGVKGVLEASARSPHHKGEARSEQRDAFVMLFPGMAGTLPFLPQLSPHPASPSSDFCPCRGHFLCPVWSELMPSPLPIPNSSFNVFSRASL